MRHSLFTGALSALAVVGTSFAAIQEPVKLDSGQVSGIAGKTAEMRIYKGIPFAATPTGNLRWRAPQPVTKWEGVRKADEFGPVCMQAGGGGQKTSEDCLYLNVWTSAKSAGDKRPVMVFIYGGGNNTGSGSQPGYDGEALATKGPVIVTFNYRLGALGFMAHPELTKESDRRASGNYGLMDQIAALQWVQKNIAAFGGNPKNVTVFGESAGSVDIASLMTSPMAKGLFQKAIGESSGWGSPKKLAEAEQDGVKLGTALGATTLAEMRSKPADAVLKAGRATNIVDGWLVPEDPGTVFAQGKQMEIPVLVGSNKDEATFFITQPSTAAQFTQQTKTKYGDMADSFFKLYPVSNDTESANSQLNSFSYEMGWNMRNWAKMQAKTGKKSYFYYFTQEPPVQANAKGGRNAGATHTAELPYVFNNLTGNRAWTDTDKQLADTMSTYWVNFATTGDPNGKGVPKWPAFDAAKSASPMVLGPKVEVGPAPDQAKLDFFQAAYDKQRSR